MLIGDVAHAAEVEISTVRFYERRGLLLPVGRTSGNYRRYADDAPLRVRFIRRAQRLGFTLTEIASALDLGSVPDGAVRVLLEAKRAEIDKRISDLQRMRAAVDLLATHGRDAGAPCPLVTSLGAETES